MDVRHAMTRWWKCDLQVATPAWKFRFPPDAQYDLSNAQGRAHFADAYMVALRAKQIDVIALADHNTGEWIDEMKAAGDRCGVVVFPGCEITTGAGADGIHIVVIGDRSKTSHDFDLLLAVLGFDHPDYPRFHVQDEDDLDSEWITELLVKELRRSRWNRQLIVVSHNANIPVLGDAERVISLENRDGAIRIRRTPHVGPPATEIPHTGPIEETPVRNDIQNIMEGGVVAFMKRERRYNNEVRAERVRQGST